MNETDIAVVKLLHRWADGIQAGTIAVRRFDIERDLAQLHGAEGPDRFVLTGGAELTLRIAGEAGDR